MSRPTFHSLLAKLRPGPAEAGERHQLRREPGVEHVLVLPERVPAVGAGGEVGAARESGLAIGPVAVPDRNPVSPPELAGNAPVPDVLHPLRVHAAPPLR